MSKKAAQLGDEVKDKVTGLVGIATAYAKHLTGCDRIFVQPVVDKEGKNREGWWVDVHCLEVVKAQKVRIDQPEEAKDRGGFMSRTK